MLSPPPLTADEKFGLVAAVAGSEVHDPMLYVPVLCSLVGTAVQTACQPQVILDFCVFRP